MKEIDIGPMGSMVLWIFVPVRRYLEQPSSLFCCLCIQEITKQVQYSPNEVGNHEMSGSFSSIVCLVTDYTLIQCCKIKTHSKAMKKCQNRQHCFHSLLHYFVNIPDSFLRQLYNFLFFLQSSI
jgi:hypothetical protein